MPAFINDLDLYFMVMRLCYDTVFFLFAPSSTKREYSVLLLSVGLSLCRLVCRPNGFRSVTIECFGLGSPNLLGSLVITSR